eukprot:scaffold15515_cov145-Skeletonema_menzelii.AAC.2
MRTTRVRREGKFKSVINCRFSCRSNAAHSFRLEGLQLRTQNVDACVSLRNSKHVVRSIVPITNPNTSTIDHDFQSPATPPIRQLCLRILCRGQQRPPRVCRHRDYI